MPQFELRHGKERVLKFEADTDPDDEAAMKSLLRTRIKASGRLLDEKKAFIRTWVKGRKRDFYL